jgi:hypothetical protein
VPAGPIGASWWAGSWADTAWEANSWSNPVPEMVFGDLTTLFVGYVQDLRDASLLARLDSTSLVRADEPTVRAATNSLDDLNTAYAEHLS